MVITKQSTVETTTEYELSFRCVDDTGRGFGFPCDVDGNVYVAALTDAGAENYEKCIRGDGVEPEGVRVISWTWVSPAEGVCDVCGGLVVLHDWFCTSCEQCGADYNGSGQLLSPRSQW